MASPQIYSASTVDQMPKHVSSGLLFGNPILIAVPDIDRTDHLLILGANPYESNGSLATAPDWPGRLQAIRERGGKVVVVDPRHTKTAANADEWHSIRPGGDALLLCAMLHVLFAEDLIDAGRGPAMTSGLRDIADAVEPVAPSASTPTRLRAWPANLLPRLLQLSTGVSAHKPSVSEHSRRGLSTLSTWSQEISIHPVGQCSRLRRMKVAAARVVVAVSASDGAIAGYAGIPKCEASTPWLALPKRSRHLAMDRSEQWSPLAVTLCFRHRILLLSILHCASSNSW
jgi:hypothetical protein